jgi:hypothetical protein
MKVERRPFEPSYRKDGGVFVMDLMAAPLPAGFEARERKALFFPAGAVAGNHRHPRREAFACLEEGLELHWLDADGVVHVEPMAAKGEGPWLFEVPPMVPHAVVNRSDHGLTLLEWADGPNVNVEPMEVAKTHEG